MKLSDIEVTSSHDGQAQKMDAQQRQPLTNVTFLKPNYAINFHDGAEVIGRFDFNGPKMTFEGDLHESVELFAKALSHWFDGRLKQERAAEREACARACEAAGMVKGGEVFAARIRARGET